MSHHRRQRFIRISKSFFVDHNYRAGLGKRGLTSIDAVFSFNAGRNLAKANLAGYRSRLQFEITQPPSADTAAPSTTVFLKRYNSPPVLTQIRNWMSHRRKVSCCFSELELADKLTAAGINTPKTIAYGRQWGMFFEKRSFIITEKIPNAESLERRLPHCFGNTPTAKNLTLRRDFIARLADFVRRFHKTSFRHRDLYLSHIFYSDSGDFYLIDLGRVFEPPVLSNRFRIKDIAQLHYSAPAGYFSRMDRLRFYVAYTGRKKLTDKDKVFIHRVINKAKRMARHNIKHGREVPFLS